MTHHHDVSHPRTAGDAETACNDVTRALDDASAARRRTCHTIESPENLLLLLLTSQRYQQRLKLR